MKKRRFTFAVAFLVVASGLTAVHAQRSRAELEKQLAAGDYKATMDGDLRAAIDIYQQVVAGAGSNRAIAAQALLRAGDAYERLNRPEARAQYEHIRRDFADVASVAASALARLQAQSTPTGPGQPNVRKVWQAGDIATTNASRDGLIAYVNYDDSTIRVRNLLTGAERVLPRDAWADAISPDGTLLVYFQCSDACQLRIRSAERDGPHAVAWEGPNDALGHRALAVSPDNRIVVFSAGRPDGTRLLRFLRRADKTIVLSKSVSWGGADHASFSPDGRFLLYDARAVEGESTQHDIFILPVDGSAESAITHPSQDSAAGWSPDGRFILFKSERRGSPDIWRQPVRNGKPVGEAVMIVAGVVGSPLGTLANGAICLLQYIGGPDVETVSVDFSTGKVLSEPKRPIARNIGSNSRPAWSPDGRSLLYMGGGLMIHSFDGRADREVTLNPPLAWMRGSSWSPDGKRIATFASDLKGRQGAFVIDVASGAVSLVSATPPGERLTYEGPMWSPDGTRLYYHKAPMESGDVLEWNFTTKTERVVIRGVGTIGLSPDGRWISTSRKDSGSGLIELIIVPVDGGAPRALWRLGKDEWVNNTSIPWTPDGRAVLVRRNLTPEFSYGKSDLWVVPVDGGLRTKIDMDAERISQGANGRISIHPDGRQIAYQAQEQLRNDILLVEHALDEPLSPSRSR